jgi:hypothetical protein
MKTENPQAFPSRGDLLITNEGMTLRDYFAAKAMNGWLSNPNTTLKTKEDLASESYLIADIMLKQRNI